MKLKIKTIKAAIISIVILVILFSFYSYLKKSDRPYVFKGDKFSYIQDRPTPNYALNQKWINDTFIVYDVEYDSRSFLDQKIRIHGFVVVPKNKNNIPGLVLLPGGAVPKEGELILAEKIAELGYAVITIDQRGIGETKGTYLSYEQDYLFFKQGKEPMQHLAVYDSLAAYDVLKKVNGVDSNNIAVAGESMGGRYAIIAAAIEKRFKGVIGISTSGFGVKKDLSVPYNSYLLSIDPDDYIKDIAPRPIFMFHSKTDSTILIKNAQATFSLANEPRYFYIVEDCPHGYCYAMLEDLKDSLAELFGK